MIPAIYNPRIVRMPKVCIASYNNRRGSLLQDVQHAFQFLVRFLSSSIKVKGNRTIQNFIDRLTSDHPCSESLLLSKHDSVRRQTRQCRKHQARRDWHLLQSQRKSHVNPKNLARQIDHLLDIDQHKSLETRFRANFSGADHFIIVLQWH